MRPPQSGANSAVEALLDERLKVVEDSFDADALAIYGPLEFDLDDTVRHVIELMRQRPEARDHLVVLIDTDGGYLDPVNRMVDTIRHHYKVVSVAVPNAAYSAGTIFAMSGDAILMDYYSRLGPIDPQVEDDRGEMIPALGYLKRYEALVAKSKEPDGLTLAEIQLLISGFDQAQLYMFDQARQLSVKLLGDWLCQYKFKDWNETETRHVPVTEAQKRARAEEIANELNNTDRWHSHSNGISAETLQKELNLKIDDFGKHAEPIRGYHELLKDYASLNRHIGVVHAVGTYIPYHSH